MAKFYHIKMSYENQNGDTSVGFLNRDCDETIDLNAIGDIEEDFDVGRFTLAESLEIIPILSGELISLESCGDERTDATRMLDYLSENTVGDGHHIMHVGSMVHICKGVALLNDTPDIVGSGRTMRNAFEQAVTYYDLD